MRDPRGRCACGGLDSATYTGTIDYWDYRRGIGPREVVQMNDEVSTPEEQLSYPEEGYEEQVCYPGDGYDVPGQDDAPASEQPTTLEEAQELQRRLQAQSAVMEVIGTTMHQMDRMQRDMRQHLD
jgi:hypothetical protein